VSAEIAGNNAADLFHAALSDPAMKDVLYKIESMRRFAWLELLNNESMPDETTPAEASSTIPAQRRLFRPGCLDVAGGGWNSRRLSREAAGGTGCQLSLRVVRQCI
jgi:hypothetical protein